MSSFQETLDAHLRAIHQRDLEALDATLASHLVLITAEGELIRSRETFLQRHRDWFASDAWRLGVEPVSQWESADLAVTVLKLDYREEQRGRPHVRATSYLTLVFERQGEQWVMVQDQNTPCRSAGDN